ncbi:DDE-type integrase/transposase/recombinase [Fervidobacterium thailandense]|uniref:Transposase n=1 Tax=Fervidobacterium thailandense TaxID=1008305 RepID=A0A1E3G070_9BACT|nr:DDE-type integrase/transposase/recombinase [Fervidobacterium thailandense]ODN29666.1 transposase [Fervidobacterium thailandense]
MPRKLNLPQRPSCPYCHHPKVYVNSRYFRRAPDGSLTQVFSFICPNCKRTFSFPKAPRSPNPNKLFNFSYPRCPHCNTTMEIYKIRSSFVRFRCRKCKYKSNVYLLKNSSPQTNILPFSPNYPLFICLLAFILFFSNLSFRQIRNVLSLNGYSPSVSTIYRWIKTLSSAIKFTPIHFEVLCVDEKFEKLASKGKTDTIYVFLAVSFDNYLIANFRVSLNRDTLEAIKLIFPCQPKLVLSDGLTSYAQACEYLNISHKTISSRVNQAVESRNSLLAMFTQIRRGFKKLSNVIEYIKAFVVLHNIKRKLRMQEPGDWVKIQRPLVEYLVNHFEELFAFG